MVCGSQIELLVHRQWRTSLECLGLMKLCDILEIVYELFFSRDIIFLQSSTQNHKE